MDDLKEYADRLKFEIVAADFLSTEDREMVFDLIEKCWVIPMPDQFSSTLRCWPLACPSGRCWAKPAASSMTVLCSGSISTSWPNQSRKTNCFSVK